jgi:hypothetical protein
MFYDPSPVTLRWMSKKTTNERSAAYKARLKAAGEPPSWAVANAFMAVVIEAKLNIDPDIPFDLIIDRMTDLISSDPQYKRESVLNVVSRFAGSRSRKPRTR